MAGIVALPKSKPARVTVTNVLFPTHTTTSYARCDADYPRAFASSSSPQFPETLETLALIGTVSFSDENYFALAGVRM